MAGAHLSKGFFTLIKTIGESKSKQEEDKIIRREVTLLKDQMAKKPKGGMGKKSLTKETKETLVRMIYIEMLGHDASFGYITAVELCASEVLLQKRVGYLACGLMLSEDHQFRFMLCNQLQRDLQSPNFLRVCTGLIAVCKLVTKDLIQ